MNQEKTETKMRLPVALSSERTLELYRRRRELAADAQDHKKSLEQLKKELGREKKAITDELATINGLLEAGAEEQLVDCVRYMEYDLGRVTIVRSDTGETVEERDMYDSERQAGLNLPESGDGGGDPGQAGEAVA